MSKQEFEVTDTNRTWDLINKLCQSLKKERTRFLIIVYFSKSFITLSETEDCFEFPVYDSKIPQLHCPFP